MKHTDKEFEKIEPLSGLRCKNRICEFENGDVQFEEYKNWVDKECEICGEVLLTQEDLLELEELQNIYKFMTSDDEEDVIKFFERT